MTELRFFTKCPEPECGHSLHPFRIVAEVFDNPGKLGVVGMVCYNCQLVFVSEPVTETMAYAVVSKLRSQQMDANVTLDTYDDVLNMTESFRDYLRWAYKQPLSEAAFHAISSLYLYLTHVREVISKRANNLRNHLNRPKPEG